MAVRTATFALARSVPYLVERGRAQTLQAAVRYGAEASMQTPTAIGSSVTILRPDGSEAVSDATITLNGSIVEYVFTPASTETLGDGWEILWSIVISGEVYPFRVGAYLCQYVPPCPISVADVLTRLPELRGRVPQQQGERGDDVGWQPQVDAAYYELLRELIANGRPIWKLRSALDYYDRVLVRACQLCVSAIAAGPDSSWAQTAKALHFESLAAASKMKLAYEDDAIGVRRSGSPVVRLAPTGRPWC